MDTGRTTLEKSEREAFCLASLFFRFRISKMELYFLKQWNSSFEIPALRNRNQRVVPERTRNLSTIWPLLWSERLLVDIIRDNLFVQSYI